MDQLLTGTPAPAAPAAPAPAAPAPATPVANPTPAGVGVTAPAAAIPPAAPVAAPPAPANPAVDPNAALQQVLATNARLAAQLQQQSRYAQLGQQAAAGQPVQPAQPAAPASPFGLPAYDPNWRIHLTQDEHGNMVERPGAPLGTLAAYMQYQTNLPAAIGKLLSDPAGALGPVLEKLIDERAAKIADQRQSQFEERQTINSIMAEVEPWAIAKNAAGQPLTQYDQNGQIVEQLTPLGQHYANACTYARQSGMTDTRKIHAWAMQQVNQAKAQMAQPAASPTPAAPQQPLGQHFMQPGVIPQAPARTPGPGGTTVPAVLPANPPGQSPTTRELFRQGAISAGLLAG